MIWKENQATSISFVKMEKYLNTFNGLSLMTMGFNLCFRKVASPAFIAATSAIFSITSAMAIILNAEIFHTLSTALLPLLVIDSGAAIILAPTLASVVYNISRKIKMIHIKGSRVYFKSVWFRKKTRSMQPIKIYIGDCYFDREMPLITVNNSLCNAISVLLGIRN